MNSSAKPATINGVDLLLILIFTAFWGLPYPTLKFAVTQYPPASFRALTFILGTLAMGLYSLWKNDALKVPPLEPGLVLGAAIA